MFVCLLISLSLAHLQIVNKNFEKVEMDWKFTSRLLICFMEANNKLFVTQFWFFKKNHM